MRLLPVLFALFLVACSDRIGAPVVPEARGVGVIQPVFIGTTRLEDDGGNFGVERDHDLSLLKVSVSIPENRALGSISNGLASPKVGRDFVMVERTDFETTQSFRSAIWDEVKTSSRRGGQEATIYVHGYNNSFTDAVFRLAQLTHDIDVEGPAIGYSWPSRAHPLGYEYDRDSALFARDGLVELLREVRASGIKRITLVAHSMGTSLVMESLRQIELSNPGWAHDNISGVILISPDLNVDVFRSQAAAFKKWPQPFVIFSSQKDIVLRLSARLRGERSRLGNLGDVSEISDLPISFIDVTALSRGTLSKHFVAGSSDTFLRLLRSAEDLDTAFLRGHNGLTVPVLGTRRVVQKATEIVVQAGEQ